MRKMKDYHDSCPERSRHGSGLEHISTILRRALLSLEIEVTLSGGWSGPVRRAQRPVSSRLDVLEQLRQEIQP
jgi:hypothetical protein